MLHILHAPGVTWVECKKSSDPICEFSGPVIDHDCNMIYDNCHQSVQKGKLPCIALAKGMWIGKVPQELSDLTWVEWLLIARVQYNSCFVWVSSGHCYNFTPIWHTPITHQPLADWWLMTYEPYYYQSDCGFPYADWSLLRILITDSSLYCGTLFYLWIISYWLTLLVCVTSQIVYKPSWYSVFPSLT